MVLFHGSKDIVEFPEIRKAIFNKDFYFGFIVLVIENRLNGGQLDTVKKDILINMCMFQMNN